jgi:protein gp37
MMDHRYKRVTWGAGEDRARTSLNNWKEPLRLDRLARNAGRIDRVFCLSLGDIWDNEVDPIWRRDAFSIMERTPNLLYLLLSKRIGNAIKMCDPFAGLPGLPSNCALGATMVNQDEWGRDIDKLKRAGERLGARFTFASVEPMLGPIDTHGELPDWVIAGGESGPNARPMHPDWARGLRDQCVNAGVPFFFKQWGEWSPFAPTAYYSDETLGGHCGGPSQLSHIEDHRGRRLAPGKVEATWDGGNRMIGELRNESSHRWGRGDCLTMDYIRVGKGRAGHLLDGIEWHQFPTTRASDPAP